MAAIHVLHGGIPFERAHVVVTCAVQAGVQNCDTQEVASTEIIGVRFLSLWWRIVIVFAQCEVRVARNAVGGVCSL